MSVLKKLPYAALVAALLAIDQAIKAYVRTKPKGAAFFSLPPLFELTHHTNTGAAFSLLESSPAVITVLSVVLLCGLCIFVLRSMTPTKPVRIVLCVMIGGGLGNLLDRLLYGGVTDYIRILLFPFPIFNFADMLITGAVFLLMIMILLGKLETKPGEYHGSSR